MDKIMNFDKPTAVSDIDVAFPARVQHLMPPQEDIPDEFKKFYYSATKWNQLVTDWFFSGIKIIEITPKKGIDKNLALRHLKCIMGSFEPKHEHKESAVAYLMSLWFDDFKYEKVKQKF